MVIKGMIACNPVKDVWDEYYTRKSAWENIQHFIPSEKVLWEAFMLNSLSSSPQYLTELGFDVEFSTSDDFFLQDKRENSVVVSNCPFSMKKEVLQHLKNIDQPFILIISSTVLNTEYFFETFGTDERIQWIIKSTKIHYDKFVDGKKVDIKDNTSFYSIYLCWQIGLDQRINFIK
jgi:hypothetical protein